MSKLSITSAIAQATKNVDLFKSGNGYQVCIFDIRAKFWYHTAVTSYANARAIAKAAKSEMACYLLTGNDYKSANASRYASDNTIRQSIKLCL